MINSSDVHLGKGPCISLFSFHGRGTLNGVIPHPALVELFEKVAKNKNINLQRSVASGILTDASYVQFANEGIASIDVGYPMRYSRSSREVCNINDLIDLKNLLVAVINKIDKKRIEGDITRDRVNSNHRRKQKTPRFADLILHPYFVRISISPDSFPRHGG